MTKSATREVARIIRGREVVEGAGVRLLRIFGNDEAPFTDPFLLLDNFGSDDARDYVLGFPWHPHRGIETVTYMIEGDVEHGDSLGNKGMISSGDIQWMTAGSGIIHKEMPQAREGTLKGYQLWVNLPAASKMTSPKYRGLISGEIPVHTAGWGSMKIIAGEFEGTRGAARDLAVEPQYYDVTLNKETGLVFETVPGHTVIICPEEGELLVGSKHTPVPIGSIALLGDGDSCTLASTDADARFLFISGRPLNEPIAWRGPIVMNTEEELAIAFKEFHEGTFVK